MNPEMNLTSAYQRIIKSFKCLVLLGEFITLVVRILSQRIFSVYIGIVLVQFIVTVQIYFRTYCVVQSRFYIIMNFILIYLLVINFIQNITTKSSDIQIPLKDNYIIDYTNIGYPLEFLFRIISTFLMWRLYQFSKLKTFQYGDVLPNEDAETTQPRRDMIHVRQNAPSESFRWGPESSRYDNENSRNLPLDNNVSRSVSNNNQRSSRARITHEDALLNNSPRLRGSQYISYRNNQPSVNSQRINPQIQHLPQPSPQRMFPLTQNRYINFSNTNQISHPANIPLQYPRQIIEQNLQIRR